MLKQLVLEYKKAIYDRGILLVVVGIFLIHLLNLTDEIRLHQTYESGFVLYFWVHRHGLGAFSLMTFLFSGLSYGVQLCMERSTGSWKYYLIRGRVFTYGMTKIVVTISTAMAACFAGYLFLWLYLTSKYGLFPDDPAYLWQMVENLPFAKLAVEKNGLFFCLNIIPEAMLFSFLAMIALYSSLYTQNRYVVLASPLLIYYGWNYLTGSLGLPDIFCWPLKIQTGFQYWESSVYNTLFTVGYYSVGIAVLSIFFMKKLKEVMENA